MHPDLALIDLQLEGSLDGPEVAARLRERFDIAVLYLTDEAEGDLLQQAALTDPFGYVLKPLEARQLRLTLETALATREKERARRDTENRLEETVAELRQRTHLMQAIFDSMSEGVIVVDKNGRQVLFNPSAERIRGIGLTDTSPSQWAEEYGLFFPDQVTLIPADQLAIVRAMRGESTDDRETFVRNQKVPEGRYINISGRPLLSDTGESRGGLIVFRDITLRKEMERKLQETVNQLERQTQIFQTVFNNMSDGVVAMDENGKELLYNPNAERIIGFRATQDGTEEWTREHGFFFPDQVTLIPTNDLAIARAMRGESTDDREMFIRNQSKPEGAYLNVSGRPLLGKLGEFQGALIVFRDITMQKTAENELKTTLERLQHQTQLLQTVFNSMGEGVFVVDADGKPLLSNPNARRIFKIAPAEREAALRPEAYEFFFPDTVTPVPADQMPLTRAVRAESVDEMEMFIRSPNVPEGIHVSVNGRPLLDEAGTLEGGVVVFRDITERVRTEEAVSRAFVQGRLEVVDTILHNIGNAINSVTIGIGTLYEQLRDNRLLHRFSALARAVEAHQADWGDYVQHDPQGQQVRPFLLALAEDLARQNE